MTALAHAWRHEAACQGKDTELFYPAKNSPTGQDYAAARAICASCKVVSACLADALPMERAAGSRHGFRAGMTPDERARLVKS